MGRHIISGVKFNAAFMGKGFYIPTRGYMTQDITRMNKSFPPGIVITIDTIPMCLATFIKASGQGPLNVLKTALLAQLAQADTLLAATRVYAFFLKRQIDGLNNQLMKEEAKVIQAMRKQSSDMRRQFTQAIASQQGRGWPNNAAAQTIAACFPVDSMLAMLEALPEQLYKKLKGKIAKYIQKYAIWNDLVLFQLWLETRKRYYQRLIEALDITVTRG